MSPSFGSLVWQCLLNNWCINIRKHPHGNELRAIKWLLYRITFTNTNHLFAERLNLFFWWGTVSFVCELVSSSSVIICAFLITGLCRQGADIFILSLVNGSCKQVPKISRWCQRFFLVKGFGHQSRTRIEVETFGNRDKFIAVAILMKIHSFFTLAVQTSMESRVRFWGFT